MKVYILEATGADEAIVNQGKLTKTDVKSTKDVAKWLNSHIVNKYLADGQDYTFKYDDEDYHQTFIDVEVSLLDEFEDLLDGNVTEIYIYGNESYYKVFSQINKIDQEVAL